MGSRVLAAVVLGAALLAVVETPASAATTIHVPGDQPTIAAALTAAVDGDTIEVAPGTYTEAVDFGAKDVVLTSTAGATTTTLRPPPGGVIAVGQGSLVGFTITEADAPFGAAVRAGDGSEVLRNRFISNHGAYGYFGSAIHAEGEVLIDRNYFKGNDCDGDGQFYAGVVIAFGQPTITNNVFLDNPCDSAIDLQVATGTIENNTIVGSPKALRLGAGGGATTFVRNNILAENQLGVWAEDPAASVNYDHNLLSDNVTRFSGIADQTGSNGNLAAQVLFLDRIGGDLRLQSGSPAVDAGTPTGAPAVDFDGTARPLDGPDADTDAEFDIGAFEWDGTEPPPVPQTDALDPGWSGDGLSTFPSRYDIALGPYGSGGLFTASYKATDGNGPMRITKFDANGAPVPGFGPTGFVLRAFAPGAGVSFPTHIVPVGLRHTIVGEHYGSRARLGVARLRSDGSYDPTFSGDGRALYKVFGLEHDIVSAFRAEVLTGGKIGLAVIALDYDSAGQLQFTGQAMLRLNANGSLDRTFSGDGILPLTLATSDVRFLPNGAAFAGLQKPTSHLVRKLTPAGTYDRTFSGDGIASAACGTHRGANLAIDTAGRPLLMCVRDTNPTLTLAMYRFTPSGAFDTTYSGDAKTNLVLHGDTDDVRLHFDATGKPWAAIGSGTDPADFGVYTLDGSGNPDPAWSSDGIATVRAPFEVDVAGLARASTRLFVTTYKDATNIAIVALKIS